MIAAVLRWVCPALEPEVGSGVADGVPDGVANPVDTAIDDDANSVEDEVALETPKTTLTREAIVCVAFPLMVSHASSCKEVSTHIPVIKGNPLHLTNTE
jgi:hypothetical protein